MSELDTVKADLETARKEITDASTVSEQARQTANDAAEYFAGMGLEGVHNGLREAAEQLEKAVAQHNTAGDELDNAIDAPTTTTPLPSTPPYITATKLHQRIDGRLMAMGRSRQPHDLQSMGVAAPQI